VPVPNAQATEFANISCHDIIMNVKTVPRPTDGDYRRLLEFRTGLRRFIRWSEDQAAAAGLTPAQHQLLLAIRGHDDKRGPTIGDVASHLLLRHHSAVELVDRASAAGLVERSQDPSDHRVARLRLTASGSARLSELAALTLSELARFGPGLRAAWQDLTPSTPS
jgi:DNA-binding MarR family transcriptional regulator